MSTLKVNTLTNVAGNADIGNVGKILKVVQTVKTDVFTHNSTSFADITGFSATITPSSSSSKILCDMRIYISLGVGSSTVTAMFNLVRGSTAIAQPSGSNLFPATLHNWTNDPYMQAVSMNFLDSPATTSATTYKVQIAGDSTAATINVNKYYNNANYNGISTLTLYEVVA